MNVHVVYISKILTEIYALQVAKFEQSCMTVATVNCQMVYQAKKHNMCDSGNIRNKVGWVGRYVMSLFFVLKQYH